MGRRRCRAVPIRSAHAASRPDVLSSQDEGHTSVRAALCCGLQKGSAHPDRSPVPIACVSSAGALAAAKDPEPGMFNR